ncbi:FAD-dependent monooxygenase [Glaciibacter sp. 2TAF33]|uniref:FAD-dependent monooxygenase n=1 Tax=Glaciibacter sp. 2TAF33 TaxID=3233015 RepID=UPI003F93678A
MRTQVAIIGAGPAGLLLGHILQRARIGFVILEQKSREYVLGRIRAGVLEQGSVDTLRELGLDAGLDTRGLTHHGIYLKYEGQRRRIDFVDLVGRTVTVYGQQALVNHLLAEHDRLGSDVRFEVEGVAPRCIDSGAPYVTTVEGERIDCDFVVGADGYHGVSRPAIPGVTALERGYPYAWLGILADVAPPTDELIYALHPYGFAMHSIRSLAPPGCTCRSTRPSRSTSGRTTGSGGSCRPGSASTAGRCTRTRSPRSRSPRCAASGVDAGARPAAPGRRRGAHRAADRRQRAQLGDRRRRVARPLAVGAVPRRRLPAHPLRPCASVAAKLSPPSSNGCEGLT